jgi:hypothetical protein
LFEAKLSNFSSVVDPDLLIPDPDTDTETDPDLAFQVNLDMDPDPAFQVNPDTDPDPIGIPCFDDRK